MTADSLAAITPASSLSASAFSGIAASGAASPGAAVSVVWPCVIAGSLGAGLLRPSISGRANTIAPATSRHAAIPTPAKARMRSGVERRTLPGTFSTAASTSAFSAGALRGTFPTGTSSHPSASDIASEVTSAGILPWTFAAASPFCISPSCTSSVLLSLSIAPARSPTEPVASGHAASITKRSSMSPSAASRRSDLSSLSSLVTEQHLHVSKRL